ncbi:MAG TPA: hypothetical protein VGF32_13150, partial [Streptosporangiaceae bacterium]
MGDERAETYLRLRAEAELRRAGAELRRLDAAAEDLWADPGMAPFGTAEMAGWKVVRAGRILVAAGALDQDRLDHLASDFHAAIKVRSRLLLNWDRRRGMLHRTIFEPSVSQPSPGASQAMQVAPIGRVLRVAGDRVSWTLHLMSLVRTQTQAVITVAMRMHWPPDGSSAEVELTGAGPHHMPYDQLWAVDDQRTRYAVRLEGGRGETVTWFGVARLSPVPERHVRRLDLVGDGTRLVQLPLGLDEAPPGRRPVPPAAEPVATGLGERLLVLEAERILASGDARGPAEGPGPGEIITVLTEAGAIAADSPVPGQLAALCQRLGAAGHGITVQPAGEIPAPWASAIAHRQAPDPADGAEGFAPLACVLPDVDGARLVLAGLSTAAGESHLHVISTGLPRLTRRYQWDWTPSLSWWLRDSCGNWHVAMAGEPPMPDDGMPTYTLDDGMQAFWLRLTPPL